METATAVTWLPVCATADIPADGGACALVEGEQVAIFNFARRGEWYATQNLCPHKQQMILARGMIGSTGEACEPKVACPYHKRTFSLLTGECLNADECAIQTYPIKVENEVVYIGWA
ncbi:MAG: nitrite reductase small subunit NirD [Hymenobacter sp.]|nr:MAG: nitrite reductase small subunit NirD [Hymenobacter sp.]